MFHNLSMSPYCLLIFLMFPLFVSYLQFKKSFYSKMFSHLPLKSMGVGIIITTEFLHCCFSKFPGSSCGVSSPLVYS